MTSDTTQPDMYDPTCPHEHTHKSPTGQEICTDCRNLVLIPKLPSDIELQFTNVMPEDEEWTAHIKLLNEWTTPDRHLRQIVQYARSGKHYPADMHVDLIEQVIAARSLTNERKPGA